MTTLRQYSHLNFVVLQLAANHDAAVTPGEVLTAAAERRLFDLIYATADRAGVDSSHIGQLVEGEDITDALASWANVADLTRRYSDQLTPSSSHGWLVLAFGINETFARHGDTDAT
ncbi:MULTISPECIES: hypothetical protein [unclassified Rathayibacter]|uniref:hypothetical protein n=1 Tax=unclassified Rathayibacter TaxID=2609250 RepID=UPI0011B0B019|nr:MULTISPECIES: hypothetical protein [unclassified Rathayibacter]